MIIAIIVKSRAVLNGMDLCVCGEIANTCCEPTSSVYPSGSERATVLAAMVPSAPGRFSTVIGWPSAPLIPSL